MQRLGHGPAKRTVYAGRASMRAALYMGALVATRHNPVIRAFYQRLLAAGKPKNPALTPCMRTLLVILNAIVRPGSVDVDIDRLTFETVAHADQAKRYRPESPT